MSDEFSIHSIFRDYTVRFAGGFTTYLGPILHDGDTIILDSNVRRVFVNSLEPFLSAYPHIVIDATEEQKSYSGIGWIIEALISRGFKKNHRLIAIGGGITQDVTAFIASILYRGIEWIFFPTTLLAQCDSCIGSKTSINFGKFKNQIGTFFPPSEVIIDTGFLDALSAPAVASGLGEMIHYFLVSGDSDYRLIRQNYSKCLSDRSLMRSLIKRSLEIKTKYIQTDEFDKKERQVFNYGHSFGHALESVTDYRIPHGIAVSVGMDVANYLSVRLGYITDELRSEIRELLSLNWGDTDLDDVNLDAFKNALSKDKKSVGGELRVILTKGVGNMFKTGLVINEEVTGWLQEWFESFSASQEKMKGTI